jgi:hypothetical protein
MLRNSNNEYQKNGVLIQPATPLPNKTVKIVYNGLLAKSGATHVLAHVGFGQKWDHIHDYWMEETSNGFETDVPVQHADTLNIAFKDCATNWDNNSGKNYNFDIAH